MFFVVSFLVVINLAWSFHLFPLSDVGGRKVVASEYHIMHQQEGYGKVGLKRERGGLSIGEKGREG